MGISREMLFGADPIKNPKMNHVYCKRCGRPLYTPMPAQEQQHQWKVFSWLILVIAYLHDCGWRTIKDGDFNGYYVCPDCLTPQDTDFKKPVIDDEKLSPYKQWVSEMREKYNYYSDRKNNNDMTQIAKHDCKHLRESGCCEMLKFRLVDGVHYHSCFYPASNNQCKKYEPKQEKT